MRTKAYRRHQAARVERRRYKSNYHRWLRDQQLRHQGEHAPRNITIGAKYLQPYCAEWVERYRQKLRDGNGSCGCVMCKPWKFGARWGDKVKFSELRALESVKDKSEPEDTDGRDPEAES